MKKLYTLLMMAMMGVMVVSLTSCEDEQIAHTLEGTWRGNLYISTEWNGRYYESTATEITFSKDPYRYSSGTGYWVDYYSGAPWDYVANHIEWEVNNRNIHIYFVEDGNSLVIRDYSLNRNSFVGYINDHGTDVDFELYNVSRPNYSSYRWGYDSWDYYYGWTRGEGSDSAESASKPRRFVRGK